MGKSSKRKKNEQKSETKEKRKGLQMINEYAKTVDYNLKEQVRYIISSDGSKAQKIKRTGQLLDEVNVSKSKKEKILKDVKEKLEKKR